MIDMIVGVFIGQFLDLFVGRRFAKSSIKKVSNWIEHYHWALLFSFCL